MSDELKLALDKVVEEREAVLKNLRCAKEMKAKARAPEARERLALQVRALTQQAHELHMKEQQAVGALIRHTSAIERHKKHQARMEIERETRNVFNDAFRAQCKANLPKYLYARLCQQSDRQLKNEHTKPATFVGWLRKKGWLPA